MRLATVIHDHTRKLAVVEDDSVALLDCGDVDLSGLVRAGLESVDAIRSGLKKLDRIPLADVKLVAPLTRFRRDILCTGWNYWDHFSEGFGRREGQDVDRPDRPTFFTKGPDTVIGPNDPIALDERISSQWDYEAELVVVIGKDGRNIPESEATTHIFGYMLANDVSVRDLQRAHGGQWLKGKSIDNTMPIGPWLTTADDFDASNVKFECTLNGQVVQSATTAQMAFSIPRLISELSEGMTLRSGDVLLTGTPTGVGNARTPQLFLKDGDQLIVRGEGLGELRNEVRAVDLTSYEVRI